MAKNVVQRTVEARRSEKRCPLPRRRMLALTDRRRVQTGQRLRRRRDRSRENLTQVTAEEGRARRFCDVRELSKGVASSRKGEGMFRFYAQKSQQLMTWSRKHRYSSRTPAYHWHNEGMLRRSGLTFCVHAARQQAHKHSGIIKVSGAEQRQDTEELHSIKHTKRS